MKLLVLLLFPGSVLLFHVARRYSADGAALLLLLVSLVFYAVIDLAGLPLLLLSIVFNFWITGRILDDPGRRRPLVATGIVVNLLPLLFYKYLRGPAPVSAAGLFLAAGIPLGLSFYTFQQITALFDVQRPGAVRLSFLRHALFAGFFAQVPSGPVSRYRDLAPQMASLGRWQVSAATVMAGGSLFVVGLAKKLFLADSLGDTVNTLHALVAAGERLSAAEAWFAVWTFVLQIYFDFSGYSDMAIGAALCFGIALPVNFNSPLKSTDAVEFISRWHISLVNWIREYLFQPVYDGVRRMQVRGRRTTRMAAWTLATVASMTVIGAWHGRQLSLILEGFASGIVIVLTRLGRRKAGFRPGRQEQLRLGSRLRLPGRFRLGSRLRLMVIVSIMMLALRAASFGALLSILRSMFDVRGFLHGGVMPHHTVTEIDYAYAALAMLIVFTLPNTMEIFGLLPAADTARAETPNLRLRWRPCLPWGLAMGGLALLEVLLSGSHGQGFIYAAF